MRVALGLILFASIQFISSTGLFAQTPSPTPEPEKMEATITFSPSDEVTVESEKGGSNQNVVPTVGLLPNQQVAVTLEFPSDKVGAPVLIASYDGGEISGVDAAVVPADQRMPFIFRAGEGSGIYRVLVRVGDEQNLLQFRVTPPAE
jgi:hypothetical protein